MKVDARLYAAMALSLAIVAMQTAVISAYRAVQSDWVDLISISNKTANEAITGWERAVVQIGEWQALSRRLEIVADQCVMEAKQR